MMSANFPDNPTIGTQVTIAGKTWEYKGEFSGEKLWEIVQVYLDLPGMNVPQGDWDASTNTPDLTTLPIDPYGYFYVVSVTGSFDLGGGAVLYKKGDWVRSDGSAYQKIAMHNPKLGQLTGINVQSGTSYSPVAADVGGLVSCTNAGAISLTIDDIVTRNWEEGDTVYIEQAGAGVVSLIAGANVTLQGLLSTSGTQFDTLALIHKGSNVWLVVGGS